MYLTNCANFTHPYIRINQLQGFVYLRSVEQGDGGRNERPNFQKKIN